jgi:soluble cytochrome b562
MYWNGVSREMAHILLTLRKWQQPEYASVVLSDETDDFIHGFDTFMDQVSESARDFAARYGELMLLGLMVVWIKNALFS